MSNQLLEEKDIRFYGIYRGKVLDYKDPQGYGRIKVQVYPVFSEIADPEALPWAVPAFALGQGAGVVDPAKPEAEGIGTFVVPRPGTFVFVFFEQGDPYQPVYFAEAQTALYGLPIDRKQNVLAPVKDTVDEPNVPTPLGGHWAEAYDAEEPNYPDNKVIKTINGIVIEVEDKFDDPKRAKIKIYHPSKSWIEWLTDGSMHIHLAANSQQVIKGWGRIYIKGNCDLTIDGSAGVKIGGAYVNEVGGNVSLTAPAVNVVAGTVTITGSAGVFINP